MNPIQLLKNRMKCKSWDAQDLAYVLEISVSLAKNMLRQESPIPIQVAKKIHYIFKIPISTLMISFYQKKVEDSFEDDYDPSKDLFLQNRILFRKRASTATRRKGKWGDL